MVYCCSFWMAPGLVRIPQPQSVQKEVESKRRQVGTTVSSYHFNSPTFHIEGLRSQNHGLCSLQHAL